MDTLFFIFEEDYLFYPENLDEPNAYQARVRKLITARNEKGSGKQNPPPPRGFEGKGSGSEGGKTRPQTCFHAAAARGSNDPAQLDEGFNENIADLVRLATFAHRKSCGDFIWVGWCPESKSRSKIHHGSHLILATKFAMIQLGNAVADGKFKDGHVDLRFKEFLSTPGIAKKMNACYCFPTMGSFKRHISGCDPTYGEGTQGRPSGFQTDSPAHGTKISHDPKGRTKWLIQ